MKGFPMPRGYIGRIVSPAEASRKWRLKNPEKVREWNKNRLPRAYNSEYRRLWWARLPIERRQRIAKVANARATRLRRWLDSYKISVGCIDCGYKQNPAALHFDHVRGEKKLNVSFAKSVSQAQTEITKCEVRCANCHAIRTAKLLSQRATYTPT